MDALERKSDAAHRRIDDLDKRLTRLEVQFGHQDEKLDELKRDIKSLTDKLNKHMIVTSSAGGTAGAAVMLLIQFFGGGM